MPRFYKRKDGSNPRESIDESQMAAAIHEYLHPDGERFSLRQLAEKYEVKKSTLQLRLNNIRVNPDPNQNPDEQPSGLNLTYGSKHTANQIFSASEEKELVDYVITACNLHHGITLTNLTILAYDFAISLNKRLPVMWHENKLASIEWFKPRSHCLKRA
jgi:hypothetical protein